MGSRVLVSCRGDNVITATGAQTRILAYSRLNVLSETMPEAGTTKADTEVTGQAADQTITLAIRVKRFCRLSQRESAALRPRGSG